MTLVEQGHQINSTGSDARISAGDMVEHQHVATQLVATMIVARPPPPKVANMEPCPECGDANPRHAERCYACHFPLAQMRAQRNAFLLAKRQTRNAAVMYTAAASLVLAFIYANTPSAAPNTLLSTLHMIQFIGAIGLLASVWGIYWWRYGRYD